MARIIEWNDEQKKQWDKWVASRPAIVQDLCRRFPLDRLYRLKTTNQRVTLYSYSENGTLTVNVTGEYNAIMFDRQVFGVKPEELEECDLPSSRETTGTILTEKDDVEAFIDMVRPIIVGNKNLDT